MSSTQQTDSTDPTITTEFTSQMVDNEGFFDAMEKGFEIMEEKLSPLLSPPEIKANTRRELQELLAQMKKQSYINGITEWTAEEQGKFFARVQSEISRAGNFFRLTIKSLVQDEILREINDDGRKIKMEKSGSIGVVDGKGNVIFSDIKKYAQFLAESFLSQEDTSIVADNLNLTISETETIQDAKKKFERYHGKYNALVLMNTSNQPIGIVSQNAIAEHERKGNTSLSGIAYIPGNVSGDYKTSTETIRAAMHQHGINIFPIIDTKSGMLIGIVTSQMLRAQDLKYHSTVDLTGLKLAMAHPKWK